MKWALLSLVALLAVVEAAIPTCLDAAIKSKPYCNPKLSAEERMEDLLAQMTQDEKYSLFHGVFVYPYIGFVSGNERLGIPQLSMEDGPQGVADLATNVTCFPSAQAVATTWDRKLMRHFGEMTATEQRNKGTVAMLGPMSNIARVPFGGRNFESSGEDPYFASVFAKEVIQGIQSKGLIACAKHFVANNQEKNRGSVSAEIDERTLWELYYPHFQASVDAGVLSFMCSYNKINGSHGCENERTLSDLRNKMGFKGYVVSDWMATHSTARAANAGLDIEMPFGIHFSKLQKSVEKGEVSLDRIDDMVRRIVTPMFKCGAFDRKVTGTIHSEARTPETTESALTLAENSVILLKNSRDILPLTNGVKTIAVIGHDADKASLVKGAGSGGVWSEHTVTTLEGIVARAGSSVKVIYDIGNDTQVAAKVAASADVAIVVGGCKSAEGSDRTTLALAEETDELIKTVLDAQKNTVVVIISPGATLMPWAENANAILLQITPGQSAGTALAKAVFGDINPSGKLVLTFPDGEDQIWLRSEDQYPGTNKVEHYSEGLFIGHRWFDAHQDRRQLFSFGHGLSYTTFAYDKIKASATEVSVVITNTGSRPGSEVVQLYLSFPESADEPPKVLRGFEKVALGVKESQAVTFPLTEKDLSVYDVETASWVPVHGVFVAHVAASAVDIRQSAEFKF